MIDDNFEFSYLCPGGFFNFLLTKFDVLLYL